MPNVSHRTLLTTAICILTLSAAVRATPINAPYNVDWTAGTGGSWATAANWSSNPAIPGSSDNVRIDNNGNVGGMPTGSSITLDGDRTVNSLNYRFDVTAAYTNSLDAGSVPASKLYVGSMTLDAAKTGSSGATNVNINVPVVATVSGAIWQVGLDTGSGQVNLNFNNTVTAAPGVTSIAFKSPYGIYANFNGQVNTPNTTLTNSGNAYATFNANNNVIAGFNLGGGTAVMSFTGNNNNYGALSITAGNANEFQLHGTNGTIASISAGNNSKLRFYNSHNTVTGAVTLTAGTAYFNIDSVLSYGQLRIGGNTSITSSNFGLSVALDPAFDLLPNMKFGLLDIGGTLTGTFKNLAEGAVVLTDNTYDLYITYQASIVNGSVVSLTGGHDIALYTIVTVVPEPATLALLALGGLCITSRRRGRRIA